MVLMTFEAFTTQLVAKAVFTSGEQLLKSWESTKLLKRDDITGYIQELYKPIKNTIANEEINNRKKQIEEIQDRIRICKEKEDEQSLIRYYDMLNKIYSLYKDTEQEQKTDNKVNNLDTSTLIKLADIG